MSQQIQMLQRLFKGKAPFQVAGTNTHTQGQGNKTFIL